MRVELDALRAALPQGGLYGGGDGGWRWSPQPLRLSKAEARGLTRLGHPLARFQAACDEIYRRSAGGSLPGWTAELLDAGKPGWLVELQRAAGMREQRPRVIRPDLVWAEDGFALTELDSVPGGIGVTAWLARQYAAAGFRVLGGAGGMLDGFGSLLPGGGEILVSEESADYRPEMEWLAGELRAAGKGDWSVASAAAWSGAGTAVYRFFELFDWESVPAARSMAEESAAGRLSVTPPFKPHLEEKLWLALLWSPSLRKVWQQTLRGSHLNLVRQLVPFGWVVDGTPLPPHAALPRLGVHSWDEVARFSQKERRLVLKVSGFDESAWGSRGVFMGHDLAGDDWRQHLERAVGEAGTRPWMVQEFREGRIVQHPVYQDDGSVAGGLWRVRLCPYFFTGGDGRTSFGGCLATLVPVDKKKIHGMRDAVLVPCVAE